MRRIALVALLLAGLPWTGAAEVRPEFEGVWVGANDDSEAEWRLDGEGRLRLNGRPADYTISGDSLIVHFDPPTPSDAQTPREVAVYRFVASLPAKGMARLFVYGFDLGKQGLYLRREAAPEPSLPEDAAPPPPLVEPAPSPQVLATPAGGGQP